jgi:hypothetical protein
MASRFVVPAVVPEEEEEAEAEDAPVPVPAVEATPVELFEPDVTAVPEPLLPPHPEKNRTAENSKSAGKASNDLPFFMLPPFID